MPEADEQIYSTSPTFIPGEHRIGISRYENCGISPEDFKLQPPCTRSGRLLQEVVRALMTSKATTSPISSLSIDNWVIPYGIPTLVLTKKGMHFISRFFQTLYSFWEQSNWRLRRTTCWRMDSQNDFLTRRYLAYCHTIWWSFSETGTFRCSH